MAASDMPEEFTTEDRIAGVIGQNCIRLTIQSTEESAPCQMANWLFYRDMKRCALSPQRVWKPLTYNGCCCGLMMLLQTFYRNASCSVQLWAQWPTDRSSQVYRVASSPFYFSIITKTWESWTSAVLSDEQRWRHPPWTSSISANKQVALNILRYIFLIHTHSPTNGGCRVCVWGDEP